MLLSSTFILWGTMGRDIRRFYEPTMDKGSFQAVLRYYIWGGKESYNIRQQIREHSSATKGSNVELPAWDSLLSFSGLIMTAPQNMVECAYVCSEFSIRKCIVLNE